MLVLCNYIHDEVISELVELKNAHAYDGTSTSIKERLKKLLEGTRYESLQRITKKICDPGKIIRTMEMV